MTVQTLPRPLPIGILASGTGTNFAAIARAIEGGYLAAEIRVLVCNHRGAPVLSRAVSSAVPTIVIDHRNAHSRDAFDHSVAAALAEAGVELVVMAGFDRLVTRVLLGRFPQRVINIHPALLPAFRGANAQEQAARYGVTLAGATVHLVDVEADHGPIIIQAAVPVVPGEDKETVRRRILEQEHRIYPYAIQLFAENRIRVRGRHVHIRGIQAARDACLVSPPLPERGP